MVAQMGQGDFADVRDKLAARCTNDQGDRCFMLDRMKLAIVAMAEGVPESTQQNVDHLYDYLRTQGLNADRTIGSFMLNEQGARVWKGEPFEQAMAYTYIATFDGIQGDWGNVRASAGNSIFLLRDFSETLHKAAEEAKNASADQAIEPQRERTSEELAIEERAILVRESAKVSKPDVPDPVDTLPIGHRPVTSDFELGYILKAVACRQLHENEELRETIALLSQVAPRLTDFARQIENGTCNTVLVIDFGTGPEKYGAGMDNVIAMFRSTMPEHLRADSPLRVTMGENVQEFPVATNVDRLAQDLKWNNLEDMRKAKSYIGTALVVLGTGLAAYGASQQDATTALIGVGMGILGAVMKANAAADVRHCELLPQRTYVALLNVVDGNEPIELAVDGCPESRMVLCTVCPPLAGDVQLRYVRLLSSPAAWAGSGRIFYSNDVTGSIAGDQLPYILGGRCVRRPTEETLQAYQRSGHLTGMTLEELEDLYRQEGIVFADTALDERIGRHILEGGNYLYSPAAGSTGSLRLFAQEHAPYVPKSPYVRDLIKEMTGDEAAFVHQSSGESFSIAQ